MLSSIWCSSATTTTIWTSASPIPANIRFTAVRTVLGIGGFCGAP
jgi:hypothetical protein